MRVVGVSEPAEGARDASASSEPAPPVERKAARGPESTAALPGGGRWWVYATAEGHVLVVSPAPKAKRRKKRIPDAVGDEPLDTKAKRARWAKGAAPEIRRVALEEKPPVLPPPKPKSSGPTFRDVAGDWTSGELSRRFPDDCPPKASVGDDRGRLRPICDAVGDVAIADFSLDDAVLAMSKLPKSCRTPATRWQYAQCIRRVLQLAVWPLRLREASPIPKRFVPRSGARMAMQWIYPSEDARLASCPGVPLERRLFWGVLAREGMRDGSEATKLTWDCLDLERGVLRLDKNKSKCPRAWKLDPGVTRALSRWKARWTELVGREPEAGDAVFLDERGERWDGTRFADAFREDLRAAGVYRPELFEKAPGVRHPIRAHDLRGTFVTVKLAIGWSEAQISARTGHRSSQMIARYRRLALTAEELEVGDFLPLDGLLWRSGDVPVLVPEGAGTIARHREASSRSVPSGDSGPLATSEDPLNGSLIHEEPMGGAVIPHFSSAERNRNAREEATSALGLLAAGDVEGAKLALRRALGR